jgi:hypothetical protein
MLSTAADLASLAQAAPWLAVGVLALVAAAWVYRQGRRQNATTKAELQTSAVRQGKRLGELEKVCELLILRRKQVEYELLALGVDLPFWPPDGPDQPRPRRREPVQDVAEDQDGEADTAYAAPERVPVPPLPSDIGARHRRPATL